MTLAPSENNLFCWKASIPGPEGSPYEGGVFNLVVELANDYPYVNMSCGEVTNSCANDAYLRTVSQRRRCCSPLGEVTHAVGKLLSTNAYLALQDLPYEHI